MSELCRPPDKGGAILRAGGCYCPPEKQPCCKWVDQEGFVSGVQGVLCRTIAFRMVRILRMQATMATL